MPVKPQLLNVFFLHRKTYRGSVDDGTTVTDFMEQEQERGLRLLPLQLPYGNYQINLIDTPRTSTLLLKFSGHCVCWMAGLLFSMAFKVSSHKVKLFGGRQTATMFPICLSTNLTVSALLILIP